MGVFRVGLRPGEAVEPTQGTNDYLTLKWDGWMVVQMGDC